MGFSISIGCIGISSIGIRISIGIGIGISIGIIVGNSIGNGISISISSICIGSNGSIGISCQSFYCLKLTGPLGQAGGRKNLCIGRLRRQKASTLNVILKQALVLKLTFLFQHFPAFSPKASFQ